MRLDAKLQRARLRRPGMNPVFSYSPGREIARGGMGAVVDARDNKLGRSVAMKVMLQREASAAERQRFLQEARVLGQLAHSNIVPVYDLGSDAQGRLFYTMKLVQGVTLHDVIERLKAGDKETLAKYPLNTLLNIFQKVCDAVAFAHSRGVIHRDLKPQNVMVGVFGEVLVLDWGLAKFLPDSPAAEEAASALPMLERLSHTGPADASPAEGRAKVDIAAFSETVADGMPSALAPEPILATMDSPALSGLATNSDLPTQATATDGGLGATLDGTVVGTPHYMSPEQAQGRVNELDARSDIFSLGGILYTLLTLRPPVDGRTLDEVLERVRTGVVTAPSFDRTPRSIDQLRTGGLVDDQAQATPLPHIVGGRVPVALSAVVMKALRLDKTQRYQNVAALTADVAAFQGGFATGAEEASALTELLLLMRRHRAVTALLALLLVLSIGFVLKVMSSERETRRQAGIAQVNEKRAIAETENTRHALAKTSLALAEAAYREANGPAMRSALNAVPGNLRDSNWNYLHDQSDTSIARITAGGKMILGVAAHPRLPGVFAVADDEKTIAIIEARTGKQLLQFKANFGKSAIGSPFCLAFSPDGERVAWGKSGGLGEGKGNIAIHTTRDGRQLLAWESTPVSRLEFSTDGLRLLQADNDGPLKLWDAMHGELLWTYAKGKRDSTAVMMPDNSHVLGLNNSGSLVLLRTSDGTESRARVERAEKARVIAIHPDGLVALWADDEGYVHGADLRDGRFIFSLRLHDEVIKHLVFTRDGERFITAVALRDGRQSIRVFNAKTGELLQSLTGGSGVVTGMAVHPLSGELLVSGHASRLWDINGVSARWTLHSTGIGGELGGAAFGSSDELFFGPMNGLRTALLDLNGPSILWNPTEVTYRTVTTSADRRFIAMGGRTEVNADTRILFGSWEGGRFKEVIGFKVPKGLTALRLSPTGDRLALSAGGAESKQHAVLDPATGKQLVTLAGETLRQVHDLHWIKGGTQIIGLATAKKARGLEGTEEQIVVWDAATGRQVHHLVHTSQLDCLAIAPDGNSFAVAGEDKQVHVFDLKTISQRQVFRAHDGRITALAWHPTRPIVATGSDDRTVKLWNLETGQRVDTFRGPTGIIRVLTFSPSGQRLACAALDQTVHIWEPPSLNNPVASR